jgi:protein-disulfide isomerase
MDELDKEADRLKEQADMMKPVPRLDKDQVNDFNLLGAPSTGPENAKLTMVVFSDFECPFCARFAMGSKQLLQAHPNDLRLVFMNFPLNKNCNSAVPSEMHPRACIGAEAAMAAAAQGKFWEMHDYLFANQRIYSVESIVAFAGSQGMDANAIKEAIETNKFASVIEEEARQMLSTKGRGTPSVFINGMIAQNARWDDPVSINAFLDDLLHPEKQKEKAPSVAPAVANPGALPGSNVVLDDGTRLEDRLNQLKEKLAAVNLAPNAPQAPPKPKAPEPGKVYSFDLTKSPAIGASEAPVTVVIFQDFLSPQTQMIAGVMKEILAQFPDKVRYVFKNLPGRGHQFSVEAHEAALTANAQAKFWPMYDLIIANRATLNLEELRKLAEQAGLDMAKYDDDMQKHIYRSAIITDVSDADKASVSMAPAVFINGKYQPDPRKEALAAAIQSALGQ